MAPIIGVVPSARLFATADPYDDRYTFINFYTRRLCDTGAIPMGILGLDGCLPPGAAPACDGFVLCGGAKLWPYHLQILDHAFQTGKPVLGVCLGMQAMSAYFKVREQAALRHWEGSLLALFDRLKQEGYLFTRPVAHHWEVNITRDNIPATKHRVLLQEGTLLRQLLGAECIYGSSMHHYCVNGAPSALRVSALAEDGTIEGLEYRSQMLGVQFHPEVDAECGALFRWLTRAAQR